MNNKDIEKMMNELDELGINASQPIGPCPELQEKLDLTEIDREAEEIMKSVGLE